jgi:hypothetical protein
MLPTLCFCVDVCFSLEFEYNSFKFELDARSTNLFRANSS